MSFYHWTNCPAVVRDQAYKLISSFIENIPGLAGVYLHGSLAMGCFNPAHSDLDLLAVTQKKIPASAVPQILSFVLEISNKPIPIEISLLNKEDLVPWEHPVLYDLHFSEEWREMVVMQLKDGSWEERYNTIKRDYDLSAYITVIHTRGVCLWGEAVDVVFPEVPLADYADSILSDVEWINERMFQIPVYTILNLSRVYAFLKESLLLSKAEGAEWALIHLETKWHSLIEKALHSYHSESASPTFSDTDVKSFYNAMVEKISQEKSFTRLKPAAHE